MPVNDVPREAVEIEEKVLDYSLQFPTQGQVRTANELEKSGIQICAGGFRSIWMRHNLQVKSLRLKRLERWAAQNTEVLTELQVKTLEDAKKEREAHGEVESLYPVFLMAQDTFCIGTIKGACRIYQQTAIDTHCNVGYATVYTDKTAFAAADLFNGKVFPSFDEHNITALRVLTDNGKEYCGQKDNHTYKLFLHLNDIDHTRIRVRCPADERLGGTA